VIRCPLLISLALCFASVGVGAQEPTPAATPDRIERARSLADATVEELDDLDTIGERVAATGGEERELLLDRAQRRWESLLRRLPELVSLVTDLREDEALPGDLERRARQLVRRVSASIRSRLPGNKEAITDLRGQRDMNSGDEFDQLDRAVRIREHWLDNSLESYERLIPLKEELGLDTAPDRAFLAAELEEHAELRASQLRIASRRLDELRLEASEYEGAKAEEARQAQVPVKRKVNELTASLSRTVGLMSTLDIDATEYRQLLLQVTGQVSGDALDAKVLSRLAYDWLESVLDWMRANGGSWLVRLIVIGAILLAFRVLAGFARRVVNRAVSGPKVRMSQLLKEFLLMAVYRGVWVIGLLVALSQLGVEIAPLLAGLGVAGFIVGFALQNSLSNFASGLMILAYRPFDVGDFIEAGGVSGVAKQLNLVSTTVVTFDNRRLVVPNTKIWEDVIVNVTAERIRRVDLVFGVSYSDDLKEVERVLKEIIADHPKTLDEPAPIVKLHNLGDSSVDFVVRPWVETKDYWEVYWDVTRQVKDRFDAEGISIPFPQRDVHFYPERPDSTERAPAPANDVTSSTPSEAAPATPPEEDEPSAD